MEQRTEALEVFEILLHDQMKESIKQIFNYEFSLVIE